MAKSLIGLGKCSKFYFYILGEIICDALEKIILKFDLTISHYPLVKLLHEFFGFLLFGTILYFIMKRQTNNKATKEDNIIRKKISSKQLIYNNILKLSKKNIFIFFICCFVYVIHLYALITLSYFRLTSLIIWTAHLTFTLSFVYYYFPQNLYNHQIISMLFVILLNTFLIIIQTFFKNENNKNIYQEKGIGFCLLIMFIYIFQSFTTSFSEVKFKLLMDFKYLSPFLILITTGGIGLFISIIISIFYGIYATKCHNVLDHDINCFGDVYSYINDLKKLLNSNKKDFYLEILLLIPLFIIVDFIGGTFIVMIIQHLNPIYIIFSDNIFYLIYYIISFIDNYKSNSIYITRFLISESGEIFEFLAICIYLEIVELRFCGLNKNTRENIALRGEKDNYLGEDFASISNITNNDEPNNVENSKDNFQFELAE